MNVEACFSQTVGCDYEVKAFVIAITILLYSRYSDKSQQQLHVDAPNSLYLVNAI